MKYKLEINNDLFFVLINDKRYLIDTGSPYTFSLDETLSINDLTLKNTKLKSALKDRIEKLSNIIKKRVDGIIGLDIIKKYGLFIDKKNMEVSFGVKDIEGKKFSFNYFKNGIYEYIVLSLNTYGLNLYGIENYLFDTGISDSIFDLSVCIHSQYAYRKDIYYLALDKTYSNDFVFETLNQKDNKIKLAASMNYDNLINEQFEFAKVKGLLSVNKIVNNYLVIDTINKVIKID